MKRRPCLDQISLDLMIAATDALSIRRTQKNVQRCAGLQIAIREAMRALQDGGDPLGDAARLDFLDACNRRLNASYGTTYRWRLILNHNVNRLMLSDMKVDLHDSDGSNSALPSCREAIDAEMRRIAQARRATPPADQNATQGEGR